MKKLLSVFFSLLIAFSFASCGKGAEEDSVSAWYNNEEKTLSFSYENYLGTYIWGQSYEENVYDRTLKINFINDEDVVFELDYYRIWNSGTQIAKINKTDNKAYFTTSNKDEYIEGWFYIQGHTVIFNITKSSVPYVGSETIAYAKLSIS